MTQHSRLDDPDYARFAWARYWRLMRWMGVLTLVVTAGVLFVFYTRYGLISIHLYLATAFGVIFTVLLAAALMGLVFLSSGTGHDESIDDPFKEEDADQ